MAYDETKVVNVKALKDTATRIKTNISPRFPKRATPASRSPIPCLTLAAREENVLYLVHNDETGHYDVYALIDGVVELLDDTTVSLDGYVTDDDLAEALNGVGGGAVYTGTKTDLKATDASVIEAYFTEHSGITPKAGDMFAVVTVVDSITYEMMPTVSTARTG